MTTQSKSKAESPIEVTEGAPGHAQAAILEDGSDLRASPGIDEGSTRFPSTVDARQGKASNSITIHEPSVNDRTATLGPGDPEKHQSHPHSSGIRHRAKDNTRSGSNGTPASPKRQFSSGPRGFMERVATGLSEPRPKSRLDAIKCIAIAKHSSVSHEPTWRQSGIAIVKASYLNVLLVFIPVSWALHFAKVGDVIIFVMSFLAIIPLAKLLGFGTEELSLRVGQTLGGLLNATLGNVVELIVAILALVKCELQIVQSSLLGSILSNLLLVLGMCFFAGGLRFTEQSFGETGAQINSSLLVISVVAVLIPAGFHAAFSGTDPNEQADVLAMSRGLAVILLVIYVAFMIFQLWSHTHLFAEEGTKAKTRRLGKHTMFRDAKSVKRAGGGNLEGGTDDRSSEEGEEDEETPSINLWSCIILLLVVAGLVGVTAEWLVDSINGLVEQGGITEQWVGLILLPIVGNAAEHVTAVTVSVKDKLDLSIGVAVGSSIQVALFLIPLLIIIAWGLGKPLSLLFDPFESVTLFLSVLIANYTMQDHKSNWLEGFILMSVYLMIAVSFWYYPSALTPEAKLLQC